MDSKKTSRNMKIKPQRKLRMLDQSFDKMGMIEENSLIYN